VGGGAVLPSSIMAGPRPGHLSRHTPSVYRRTGAWALTNQRVRARDAGVNGTRAAGASPCPVTVPARDTPCHQPYGVLHRPVGWRRLTLYRPAAVLVHGVVRCGISPVRRCHRGLVYGVLPTGMHNAACRPGRRLRSPGAWGPGRCDARGAPLPSARSVAGAGQPWCMGWLFRRDCLAWHGSRRAMGARAQAARSQRLVHGVVVDRAHRTPADLVHGVLIVRWARRGADWHPGLFRVRRSRG
jgi:hypothetical protein